MIARTFARLALLVLATSAPVGAQTGTLDQVSPYFIASFNCDASFLVWQAQVRAGMDGQLEGFYLRTTGPLGGSMHVRVRAGAGWSSSPILYQGLLVKPTSGTDDVFVDVTSAAIWFQAGDPFVIEMQGNGAGVWVNGSWSQPPAAPLYPEPLYSSTEPGGCYGDCGWRIAFRTFMIPTSVNVFCPGDGSGAACPCGNASAPGADEGCLSSLGVGGRVRSLGLASLSADALRLLGTRMPNAPALYFQGTSHIGGGAGIAFGDGLRCAGGTIVRLGTKLNAGGASQYPGAGDPPVSVQGQVTNPSLRTYQVWYRNAAAFCTASTYNLTNAVEVIWGL